MTAVTLRERLPDTHAAGENEPQMAQLSPHSPSRTDGRHLRQHRVLVHLDVIFGAYCVAMASAATLAWWNGDGSLQTAGSLLAFLVANIIISQVSRRAARPALVELGRLLVGGIIAALAYLTTEAPFGMWWPGFLIMALGGTVFFGLMTGSALPGRLITSY